MIIKEELKKMRRSKYKEELRRYLWEDWENDMIPFNILNNIDLKVMARYWLRNECKVRSIA